MHSPETLKRHAGLVDDMATARGLDLEELTIAGALSLSELGDAVVRCTGCARPDDCAHWLSQQRETTSEAPAYCKNGFLFDELKKV